MERAPIPTEMGTPTLEISTQIRSMDRAPSSKRQRANPTLEHGKAIRKMVKAHGKITEAKATSAASRTTSLMAMAFGNLQMAKYTEDISRTICSTGEGPTRTLMGMWSQVIGTRDI